MTKPQANSKRPEKLSAIAEIDEFVKNSGYCFVLNYGGLNVEQLAALRVELGKAKSSSSPSSRARRRSSPATATPPR